MNLILDIGHGDPKEFAENMKAQKRWIVEQLAKYPENAEVMKGTRDAWNALNGLLNFLDAVEDCLYEQSSLTEKEVFDILNEEEVL